MPSRDRRLKEKQKAAQHAEFLGCSESRQLSTNIEFPTNMNSDLSVNLGPYMLKSIKFDDITGDPYIPIQWGKDGIAEIIKNKNKRNRKLSRLAGPLWGKIHRIPEILQIAEANSIKVSARTLRRYFKEGIAE
jgi:hypothetical protein